jgi:hypothetical protein
VPKVQDALLIDYGEGAAFSPDGERDAAAMLRALRRVGQEPALFVVIAEGAGRAEFLRRLGVWQRLPGVPRIHEIGQGAEGIRRLDLKLRGHGGQHAGMLVPDADLLTTFEDGRVLDGLNIARDSLERVARGPLVLVFSPSGARQFAAGAPDLFDGRTMTAVFDAAAGPSSRGRLERVGAGPMPKRDPRVMEARIRAEMSAPEVMPMGLAIDGLLTVAEIFYARGQRAECLRVASECLELSRQEDYAEGIGRALARCVGSEVGFRPARELDEMLAEAMTIAQEHRLDRLQGLVGTVAAHVALVDHRPLDALKINESVVIPAAESLGNFQVSLRARAMAADMHERFGVSPRVSPEETRELLRGMEQARLSPDSIRFARLVHARVLSGHGTQSALREAHTLLSEVVPTLTPDERAGWQPLYDAVRARLGNESPVGPNRAARRAKLRRR